MGRRFLVAGALTFVLAVVVAGCSAILGDATYECTSGASACPSGMTCNLTTQQCEVAVACPNGSSDCPSGETCSPSTGMCISDLPDATADAPPGDDDDDDDDVTVGDDSGADGTPGSEAGPSDGGTDGPPDTGPAACTSTSCATGTFCATADDLGNAFPSQCTKTCCTSTDCASGSTCVPVGNTGSYCLPGIAGVLPQACCSSGSCGGKDCHFGAGGSSGTSAFGCSTSASGGQQEDDCLFNSDCQSGYCGLEYPPASSIDSVCREHCCSSAACGGVDAGLYCHVESSLVAAQGGTVSDGKDYVAVCYNKKETTTFENLRNIGTGCEADTDCKTGLCDIGGTGKCVDVCCVDSDCTGGQVCRPRLMDPPFLRCVSP